MFIHWFFGSLCICSTYDNDHTNSFDSDKVCTFIVGPPPFIKVGGGGGRSHLGAGVPKILLEREDNPKKGGLM